MTITNSYLNSNDIKALNSNYAVKITASLTRKIAIKLIY